MKKPVKIAAIGDVCIDIYPQYNKSFPGGTAFNTAVHATRAGARASIFSAIGTDTSAKLFQNAFKLHGIDTAHVKILQGETSSIRVNSDDEGQRSFSEWNLGVLKEYHLQSADIKKLGHYDIAKITLFKPLHQLFDAFCQANLPLTVKVADFAGSSAYSEGIVVIQRYINYLDIIIKSVEVQDTRSLSFLRQLSVVHKGKLILALLGEKGSIVYLNGETYQQPAIKTQVKDTNGAGDAYVARFLISYQETSNITQAMSEGSKVASKEISHVGAAI